MTLFSTQNDLAESIRADLIQTLNLRLADAIALQTQVKQAHWNVKGPNFIALHRLFDAVQLGGVAEGTAKMAVQRTQLAPYPLDISTGRDHCAALSRALATFARAVRRDIDTAGAAGDQGTADIFTQISRGTDQWLWMVEAQGQADA